MSEIEAKKEMREWSIPDLGIEVRAVLVKDVPYKASSDSNTEVADLWFMFISIAGNDSWVGYAIVDTLDDEPEDGLSHLNPTQLKKHSIVIGDTWQKIKRAPAQNATRHQNLAADAEVVNDVIMEMSFTELQEHRQKLNWEGITSFWMRECGMILSLDTTKLLH